MFNSTQSLLKKKVLRSHSPSSFRRKPLLKKSALVIFNFHISYSVINVLPSGICTHYSPEMALAEITNYCKTANRYFSGFFKVEGK